MLAVAVFIRGKGWRRRVSSTATIIYSIIIFMCIQKMIIGDWGIPVLHMIYPFVCAAIFLLHFAIEWATWFFKDRGYRGWFIIPLVFFVLPSILAFDFAYHRLNYNGRGRILLSKEEARTRSTNARKLNWFNREKTAKDAAEDWGLRRDAVFRINNIETLASIATSCSDQEVCGAVVSRLGYLTRNKNLDCESAFSDIVKNCKYQYPRMLAIDELNDKELLSSIAENDSDNVIRNSAKIRLNILENKRQ